MRHFLDSLFFFAIIATATAYAAESKTGPVLPAFGPVFEVPANSYNLDPDTHYKVVMDVGTGQESIEEQNGKIESVARFLNMHARNGIPAEHIEMAVVLHGSGARASLTDEAHQLKFKAANPNRELVEALVRAGVSFYLCGQTAGYYGYTESDLLAGVHMAVSAMTAHVRLQHEGYQPILF